MHLTSANVVNGADRPVFPHMVVTDFKAAPGTFGCEIPSLEVRVGISTLVFGPFPSVDSR